MESKYQDKNGYVRVRMPHHPYSNHGYVYEHRIIIETILGYYLPAKCVIHHVDVNRSNNANYNLVVCENRIYHRLLHHRARLKRKYGNANLMRCSICKTYDIPDNLYIWKRKSRHANCFSAYKRFLRKK